MSRNATPWPPADVIDAELETLDEEDQTLLADLERFTALQAQCEAQRKDIESKRRQLEREKLKRKEKEAAEREAQRLEAVQREKERCERELKESRDREKEAERRRKGAGRGAPAVQSATRTPRRASNALQEQETWEIMSGNDICTRCKEREDDCYRPKARGNLSSTPIGSGQIALEKGMRCRGCRDSKKKCSTVPGEPATPTPAGRVETSDQSKKKRKATTDDAEVATQKRVRTGLQLQLPQKLDRGMPTSERTMGELEGLFADLVKYQEVTLSIQRDILRTIRSSRTGDFEPLDAKEEEADELLLGSDMGYELEYAEE